MGSTNEFQFTGVKVTHPNGPVAKKSATCCSTCGQKANFFVTQVSGNGKLKSKSFCLSHAYKSGLFHPKAWDLLGITGMTPAATKEISCRCGMNEELLKLKGRVGCADCYKTFGKLITPLVKKIHDASVHAGKSPKKFAPRINVRHRVEILRQELDQAVRRESYEQAAEIRDEIKKLAKAI